jgi:Bacteriocin-protection, YdeI or OmpD-Associated/Domain of unknown function (DUF1905)
MAEATFRAEVRPSGRGGGHLVEIPADVVAKLGGRGRIAVTATFDGIPYSGSIVSMGGSKRVLGVRRAILAEAGKGPGDTLTVVVRNDDAPRSVEIPDELAKALRANEAARTYFESLSYTHRREYADHVTEAKKAETRTRRAARTIESLTERAAKGR